MRRVYVRPLRLLVAALIVLVAGAATMAVAARRDTAATGVIKGCYKPSNGTLYVVDRANTRGTCQPGDVAIQWNVTGPQGPKGDTGPAGPQGEKGDKGDTGATGPAGPQGERGDTGATGAQGPQGEKGDKGEKGDTGDTGARGPAGESVSLAAIGPDPATCPAGGTMLTAGDDVSYACNGERGPQGLQGETGATGATGATGPVGPAGPAGPAGSGGFDGSYTSANGLYTLRVTNTGILVKGPGGSLVIDRWLVRLLGDPWYAVTGSPR